jgi:hypothetical protein
MLQVPGSLAELVSLFAGCFTQPTFRTFRALLVGFIATVGEHTITGCLLASGMAGCWHHSRAHRFFARARWSTDALGVVLLDFIVARLIDAGEPIVVAIDDTLLKRSGRRVWGAAWHHDPIGPALRRKVAWGNNWVVAAVVVRLPFLERPVALPVLCRLQPSLEARKHELAAELIALISRRYADRRVDVVGDGHYAGHALICEPNVTLTARLRVNASLCELPPPPNGKPGRPRTTGPKLPPPAQIAADPHTTWQTVRVDRYQQTTTLQVHRRDCLWYTNHRRRPLTILLVRDPTGRKSRGLMLFSTDLEAPTDQLIERYASRWSIEVAFEDAKQLIGVGQARNRTEQAVKRTVPFGLLCLSLTIIWYALHGHSPTDVAEHRARAPWYRTKTNPSTADMLAKLRRTIIAAQYSPGRLHDPYRQKITAIQHAWATARR